MKVLVTGATGQLGQDVCHVLSVKGIPYRGICSIDCDIRDQKAVEALFRQEAIEAVIHCAAYSKVDLAEEEPKLCYQTNVYGTSLIADACDRMGIYLLYISSDYVFDGSKTVEYETYDEKNPLSVYGKSKSEGEKIVLQNSTQNAVLRTSWLFGPSQNNFVEAILRSAQKSKRIRVVSDQIGSPTYTKDLACLVAEMTMKKAAGIYHGTNEGACTWAQFANEILSLVKSDTVVEEIPSAQYPSRALRPHNSQLSKTSLDKAGLSRLPLWKDGLVRYLNKRGGF